MAELRSFLVGVVIAGVVLLFAGVAFGLFGGGSSGSPSVRLLGTPPATRTPPPAVTRDPSEFTPVAPLETPTVAVDGTPGEGETPAAEETPAVGETPNPIVTAEPTLETAPTEAPTAVPVENTPVPDPNTVQNYVDAANSYTPDLVAQLEYLAGNAGAPAIASPEWRQFTVESAQRIQGLAGSIGGIAAPGCLAGPHGSLVAAANQASGAAGAVIAAVNSNAPNDAAAQVGNIVAARDGINSAVVAISGAVGQC